ncbi:MAG: glycosyltransferase 87 family protein, partial [Actinomycetes bacterium]
MAHTRPPAPGAVLDPPPAGTDAPRSLGAALAPLVGTTRRLAVTTGVVVAATRLVTIAAIALGARHHHVSLAAAVTHLDGQYYGQIAVHGYPANLTPGINAAGYFPLFPLSTRPLLALGLPFWQAALLVVTVCSVVAGALIAVVVRHYAGPVVGMITAALVAVSPLAGVLSEAYSEALMTMLAAACLLALLRRRWLWAGVLASLAGFTRPTGAVLVLCCAVAALDAARRRREWGSVAAVVLAPIGPVVALAWIGASVGRWDGFFVEQRRGGPGSHLDGGVDTVRAMFHELTGTGAHHFRFGPEQAVYTLVVVALIVWAARQRPPAPVLTLAVGIFVLT